MNQPDHSRGRKRAGFLVGLGVAALTAATAGVTAVAGVTIPASASARPASSTVTVDLSGRAIGSLPARYLGLSYPSGTNNTGQFDTVGDLPALLENLGIGVLRFGGNTVDRASYHGASPAGLKGLARLVRATDWHVIYSVNLGHFSAAKVTSDAKAVAAALGGHLTAIACGNEPDGYVQNGIRPSNYTEADYLKEAAACIKAVHQGAKAVRISGPDTYTTGWLPAYAAAEKGTISLLAEHYYPLNNCHGPSGTAATLLSAATAAKEAATIATAEASAHHAGVPLRISEANSAACGGIPGVSNAYVSALWAVDYLLTGAEHGASGMYLNGFLSTNCRGYTPLCQVRTNQYTAQPVYYGMLFTHLLGAGHLLPVTVKSASHITAHALRSAQGTVRVVIENLTSSAAAVSLHAGSASGTADVLHLTGPSLAATSGVRIQGAAVPADGNFIPGAPSHIRCHAGSCRLDVAADSAVMITLP